MVKFSRNGVLPPESGVPPPEIAVPPPVIVPPPGRSVTRGQILRLFNAPNTISAGAPPQTPLAEITALAQNHWKAAGLLRGMRGKEGKRRGED